ncbi:MAG: ATP-dependent 6-phosphofructokinase [Dehalococcoidia bacterium]|nr:ATP-dependent 6-phosphofructokinase [Dehalococcoidia bacterium]
MRKSRIGILTGGGDCAGLNPAIKWVVKTATDERLTRERGVEYEVVGIRDGWKGLMDVDSSSPYPWQDMPQNYDASRPVLLTQDVVRTWDRYGGTYLGTSRTNPYDPKNNRSQQVVSNIKMLGLDALITIGGEDTLGVAYRLSWEGVNVVGIPKTIDRDLPGTEYTLGFDTAVNVITEEVDRLRTTAGSHKRIFVVETMGRHAGWLALEGGEASGAFIILIPEYNFSLERVYELIRQERDKGARYNIIVVAEGAKPDGGREFVLGETLDSFGHKTLGGVGDFVAKGIAAALKTDTRSMVLSHLQRGGAPSAFDRRMGRYFGIAAVDLIVNGEFTRMVSLRNGKITSVPLEEATGRLNLVNVVTQYDADRYNGRRSILNVSVMV